MNNETMIWRLKNRAEIPFAPGLSEDELASAEAALGFRFPTEFRTFLACGEPCAPEFFDYRDRSEENIAHLRSFYTHVEDALRFDLERNREALLALLGEPIVSFVQPVDVICYGSDLENYFDNEFLRPGVFRLAHISDRIRETGIWHRLLEL